MQRKVLVIGTVLLMLILAACAIPAPEGTEEAASEMAAPTEEAAEEVAEAESEESAASGEEVTYTVDAAASAVVWTGAKPLQYTHTGTVDIAEGTMTFAGTQLVGSSFTIDMTTIDNTDLSGDEKTDLESHLNSDDFFGVETYPSASLVIKSAEPTDVENQYTAVADLTIKDITNEITFVTDVEVGEGTLTATADFVFDRAQFDVQFGSGSFFDNLGDRLIADEVEMSVTLVASS